jgi:hypothetical protein
MIHHATVLGPGVVHASTSARQLVGIVGNIVVWSAVVGWWAAVAVGLVRTWIAW